MSSLRHMYRNPTIIGNHDGSTGFVADILSSDSIPASDPLYAMTLAMSDSTPIVYSSPIASQPLTDDRILLFGSSDAGGNLDSLHWVPYINSNDPSDIDVLPFKEVFCPRVQYDDSCNRIVLWFRTNVSGMNYYREYDPAFIYEMNETNSQSKYFGINGPEVARELLVCFGFFIKIYVDGGMCYECRGDNPSFNVVPIFTKPRLWNFSCDAWGLDPIKTFYPVIDHPTLPISGVPLA